MRPVWNYSLHTLGFLWLTDVFKIHNVIETCKLLIPYLYCDPPHIIPIVYLVCCWWIWIIPTIWSSSIVHACKSSGTYPVSWSYRIMCTWAMSMDIASFPSLSRQLCLRSSFASFFFFYLKFSVFCFYHYGVLAFILVQLFSLATVVVKQLLLFLHLYKLPSLVRTFSNAWLICVWQLPASFCKVVCKFWIEVLCQTHMLQMYSETYLDKTLNGVLFFFVIVYFNML